MAQNRTNGSFVSNMYEILNAYKYFRILLHFGNHTGGNLICKLYWYFRPNIGYGFLGFQSLNTMSFLVL